MFVDSAFEQVDGFVIPIYKKPRNARLSFYLECFNKAVGSQRVLTELTNGIILRQIGCCCCTINQNLLIDGCDNDEPDL
jgi:hypothetical protein